MTILGFPIPNAIPEKILCYYFKLSKLCKTYSYLHKLCKGNLLMSSFARRKTFLVYWK